MIERWIERFLFNSRWLLAPFYIILVFCLAALLFKMGQHALAFFGHLLTVGESDVIIEMLRLIDYALSGALLVLVIFSGYENFVSRIDTNGHEDWPEWISKIDFSGLKLKLMSSIVAISAIQLLSAFMEVSKISDRDLMWYCIIHVIFVFSGVVLALSDRISGDTHHPTDKA